MRPQRHSVVVAIWILTSRIWPNRGEDFGGTRWQCQDWTWAPYYAPMTKEETNWSFAQALKHQRKESPRPHRENECLRPEYIVFVFWSRCFVAQMVEVRRINGFHVGPRIFKTDRLCIVIIVLLTTWVLTNLTHMFAATPSGHGQQYWWFVVPARFSNHRGILPNVPRHV